MDQQLRFVTAPDGVKICCGLMGSGPSLVKAPNWLSHVGMDLDSPVWRHWWAELSARNHFIRFDQRGCGLSDWDVADISLERWVTDLESVVDSLGLDTFDLLGLSQGGAVAVEYAVRHPERVRHLVLLGSFARGWAVRGQQSEYEALLALMKLGWGGDNPAYRQLFTSQFMPDATLEEMNWFNELQRLSSSAENAVRFQMAVANIDVSGILAQVMAPTLVFHSRYDARVPFDEGRFIAASIPGATFVPLPSKNHILLEKDPAWGIFHRRLRLFLSDDAPEAEGRPRAWDAATGFGEKLTRRELEVLRLVADGKTDRQIAEDLVLSVRTIESHVNSMLAKTGCANRTAAALYAARNGLL